MDTREGSVPTATGPPARRNLPGRIVDTITDGVPPHDLRRRGDRAVWAHLVSTAASAQQRGWDQVEWAYFVDGPGRVLGHQARITYKRGRPRRRTPLQFERLLADAWDAAGKWLTEADPAAPDEDPEHVAAVVAAARALVADADADLTDAERAVYAHATDWADARGTTRPALPRAEALAATGLGLTALRTALARLERRGLLILEVRGRRRGDRATRPARANLYRLAAPISLCRETRHVVPPSQTCGAPSAEAPSAPPRPVVPPSTPSPDQEPAVAVHLKITPNQLAAVLAALAAHGIDVAADSAPTSDHPPRLTVVPPPVEAPPNPGSSGAR